MERAEMDEAERESKLGLILEELEASPTATAPHAFCRLGWRFWLCRHCFAPKALHPRARWVRSRPLGDHTYLSPDAPHFTDESARVLREHGEDPW